MDTFIAVVRSPYGDGHCGGNNVIDSVLQYAEYRIDYFSRLNVKRLRPFHNFRIVSEYIVDPFLEDRNVFFYLFAIFTNVAPSSGTTTSITITIIQITKQIESTRLTGLASFCAVFSLVSRLFRTDDVL